MNTTFNKKQIYIIAGVIILCLVVAGGVYASLKLKNDDPETQPSGNGQVEPSNDTPKTQEEADDLYNAADEALRVGDVEKGLTNLTKAQEIYKDIGDVIKLEQTKDQIVAAEQAIEAKKAYEASQKGNDSARDRSKEEGLPEDREMDKTNK